MSEGIKGPQKLFNKNFLLLCNGQVLSSLGSQFSIIALTFWIKHATESAAVMGTILMLGSIPAVLLGPLAGTFADRFSRRRIIIVSDIFNGMAALSLAGMMMFIPANTSLILSWLAVVYIFAGTLTSFLQPALIAAIPDVVPEKRVVGANSVSQFLMQGSVFLGQGLGGLLYRVLGAPVVFVIDGFTYLVSAICAGFTTIPQTIPEKNSGWKSSVSDFKRDLSGGFVYVWKRAGLRELVCISALMVFFSTPVIVLLPFFVEDVLKLETDWYGYIIAVYGVGSMAGFLLAGAMQFSGRARYRSVVFFIVLQSAGYVLLGLVRNPLVVMSLALAGGAAGGFVAINITTILQVTTPSEFRGRVFAILGTISGALAPVAMGLSGVVADMIGQNITLIYISCGCALVVVSFGMLVSRTVKNLISQDEGSSDSPTQASGNIKLAFRIYLSRKLGSKPRILTVLVVALGAAGYVYYVRGFSVTPTSSTASYSAEIQQRTYPAESLAGADGGQDASIIRTDPKPKSAEPQKDMVQPSEEAARDHSQVQDSNKTSLAELAAELSLKDAMILELRAKLKTAQSVEAQLLKEIEKIRKENAKLQSIASMSNVPKSVKISTGDRAGEQAAAVRDGPSANEVGLEPDPGKIIEFLLKEKSQ